MQRICLALMRFCLSAWVGISIFFVMLLLDLRRSDLFDRVSKFNHPKVLFPLYYEFEFALLGAALVCAGTGLWNARTGIVRKYVTLALVFAAAGLAAVDYSAVYRKLLVIMETPNAIPASQFVELHQTSRVLNMLVLGLTAVAACHALWPEAAEKKSQPPSQPPGGAIFPDADAGSIGHVADAASVGKS